MVQPTKDQVKRCRLMYPAGCRVELVDMNDYYAPPLGTQGTVQFVDDTGTVHISWDSGSSLGAVYGIDTIKRIG